MAFGYYYVNLLKTWLVNKDNHKSFATLKFCDSRVNIVTDGQLVLGSPIGTPQYISGFVQFTKSQTVGARVR